MKRANGSAGYLGAHVRQALMAALLFIFTSQVFAQAGKDHFTFVNVVDSTQGFRGLSNFPAINDSGSVAFVAVGSDGKQGVFKSRGGKTTTIAVQSDGLSGFGDDVVINASDVVGYEANTVANGTNRGIFTSNGVWTKSIVITKQHGLISRFLGSPSINDSGTVAFAASRSNFSRAAFIGDGESLTLVADTEGVILGDIGNVAINNSARVTFAGAGKDGSPGLFVVTTFAGGGKNDASSPDQGSILTITDPNSPIFSDPFVLFGDAVISDSGIVANVAFLSNGNMEVFTGKGKGVTARTDPENPFFASSEHPSVNSHGTVAFFATERIGRQGIFIETTGGDSPIAVIETGDPLFGSTVTGLDLGRFALNEHDQMAIHYDLQDGRSGVAIVSAHN